MWMVAMVPNELPFVVFAYLAAATLVAALQHDLGTSVGLIGLALAVLSTGALVAIVWRATRTRGVVSRRCARRSASTFPAPGWRCCTSSSHRSSSLVATSAAPRTSRTERAQARVLDVYLPRRQGVTGPVLVYFHGGGYRGGAKNREARPLVYRLASQGWLCVSTSYALRPAPFSESLADTRGAVAWARTRAE